MEKKRNVIYGTTLTDAELEKLERGEPFVMDAERFTRLFGENGERQDAAIRHELAAFRERKAGDRSEQWAPIAAAREYQERRARVANWRFFWRVEGQKTIESSHERGSPRANFWLGLYVAGWIAIALALASGIAFFGLYLVSCGGSADGSCWK